MDRRFFLFDNGKIVEVSDVSLIQGEKLYFLTSPQNFLELIDVLKKLSYLCNGVYISFSETDMNIFLFKRDSLALFTKLHLSEVACQLDTNERLKNFLYSIED